MKEGSEISGKKGIGLGCSVDCSATGGRRDVEGEKGHSAFEFGKKGGMFFASRRELLLSEDKGVRYPTVSYELDKILLLKVKVELGIAVKDLCGRQVSSGPITSLNE